MHVETHVRAEWAEHLSSDRSTYVKLHFNNGTFVEHFAAKACATWPLHNVRSLKSQGNLCTCVVPSPRKNSHSDVLVWETRDGQIRSECADRLTHHTRSGSQPKPRGEMKADWSGRGWWGIPDGGLMLLSHLTCLLACYIKQPGRGAAGGLRTCENK